MKISWGYRVAMLYISFALFIVYFITRSMHEKIDLVVPDYYEQELKYQDRLESTNRNNSLSTPLTIGIEDNHLVLRYPEELRNKQIKGNILVFRPSDKSSDRNFPVQPGTDLVQRIPATQLIDGMYRVKVEFESSGQKYYSENQVIIP
jgi:hypothetical protein